MSEMATGAPDLPTALEQLRRRVNAMQRSIDALRETTEPRLSTVAKVYLAVGLAVLTWGASQTFSLNREMGEVRTQLISLEKTVADVEKTVTNLGTTVEAGFARIEARLPPGGGLSR